MYFHTKIYSHYIFHRLARRAKTPVKKCAGAKLAICTRQGDNKKMWRLRIHPFQKDPTLPEGREVTIRRGCEIPGCPHLGEYRAPRSRYDLQSYYWFCLDHVREYNQNWDFFKGMNRAEIEHHMYKTMVWDRPSWRANIAGDKEQTLREKIYAHFSRGDIFGDFGLNGEAEEEPLRAEVNINAIPHPTLEALSMLDLTPPVGWPAIKARYKALAKKHHPDTNQGDRDSEEIFKKISLAYHILKISYQHVREQDDQ